MHFIIRLAVVECCEHARMRITNRKDHVAVMVLVIRVAEFCRLS